MASLHFARVLLLLPIIILLIVRDVDSFLPMSHLPGKGCHGRSHQSIVRTLMSQNPSAAEKLAQQEDIGVGALEWRPDGYNFWEHQGQRIHFTANGDSSNPPVLLIHGFGASHFHWRYNIPELAKQYRVYAIDLLGFGLSDKPVIEYNAEVWCEQAAAFIKEIIRPDCGETSKVVVAGNSLGGYTALAAASGYPDLISSCVMLNGAGRFETPEEKELRIAQEQQTKSIIDSLKEEIGKVIQRAVIAASFVYTKQPMRIKQVLTQVYPVDASNVDDALVESIYVPALHPNAAEVFYRIINRNGNGPQKSVNELLNTLAVPLLLLWGEKDPWIRPAAADKIQALFPDAKRVSIDAGHCPHDEAPDEVNKALLAWCEQSFQKQA